MANLTKEWEGPAVHDVCTHQHEMKWMVELHDIERQDDISTWPADTMIMVAYVDPSAQLKRRRTATGDWVLRIQGEGLASEFHCSHLQTEGLNWWIPEHAADERYDIIGSEPLVLSGSATSYRFL